MDRMTEVITFTNISNKEFSWPYNGELWTFPAGETKALPRHLAEHFAKHLADQTAIAGKAHEEAVAKILGEAVFNSPKEEKSLKEEVEELNESIKEEPEAFAELKEEPKEEALMDLPKAELRKKAKELGVDVKAKETKASLVEKIEAA